MSDLHQLRHEVWSPILKTKCLLCHSQSGVARNSALLLVDSYWGPTYMEENRNALQQVALNERDGVSLLLLKPTNQVSHAGGKHFSESSAEYKAIEAFVHRLKNPTECEDEDKELAEAFGRVTLIDESATLRKAALNLVGRLPTSEEYTEVRGGGAAALDQILDKMMHEEAFYDRLLNLFNDFLLTDRYMPKTQALDLLDRTDYPDVYWFNEADVNQRAKLRSQTNSAIARDALNLMIHVLRNDRSFSEILTADYMIVNPYSAKSYSLDIQFNDPDNPKEYKEAKIPGIPHSGILTSTIFLNRYPTTDTNRNRHRSRKIFEYFLATDVQALATRPIDPSKVVDHNPTLNNPSCSSCHANIDPVAGAMKNWDNLGRYRPPLDGWFPGMVAPGLGGKTVPPEQYISSARWLAHEIVADKRFSISVVHMVYKMLTGQTPLVEPSDTSASNYEASLRAYELQNQYFSNIARAFRNDGSELRTVVKEIVKSPYYRADESNEFSGQERELFADLGSQRLLTPEQLDLKITALTGYPWKARVSHQNNLLSLDRFRIYYGGIDSESVVQRISAPSGVMVNVSARMAQEIACYNTARDFALEQSKRRLFPHVELSQVPLDSQGAQVVDAIDAIRKNIQHLHSHLLGETLELSSAEINRTYDLFLGVWTDGQKGLADSRYSVNLPGPCRYQRSFWDDRALPKDERTIQDANYSVRAWMAVMTYLLSDYRFLYE